MKGNGQIGCSAEEVIMEQGWSLPPEESHQGESNKTDGYLRMDFGFGLMRYWKILYKRVLGKDWMKAMDWGLWWTQPTNCHQMKIAVWTFLDTWSQIFVFIRQEIWGRICRVLGRPWCGVLRSHWHTVTVTRIRLLYKCHIITTCDMISSYSLSTVLGNIICLSVWDFWGTGPWPDSTSCV